jgi:ElaB/YqjD/DUF883 family membrane-anchored ribosome-binding protein
MSDTVEEVTKEQLIADFQKVVADAEALLKATAKQGGEELAGVRTRAEESLRAVKDRISREEAAMIARGKQAAGATDVYVHENPWLAVAVAAGVGLVIGVLSSRR